MTTSNPTENPTIRLARYLKEYVGLRTTTIRDISKYDAVMWLHLMPQDSDCWSPAWCDDHDGTQPWLEVRKQTPLKMPDPPEIIIPWVDIESLRKAQPIIPELRSTILSQKKNVIQGEENQSFIELHLDDYPEVIEAYEVYRPQWERWSVDHRRRQEIQSIYAKLFNIYTQLQKQGEFVEFVLGIGFLEWLPQQSHPSVRRHIIVAEVEIQFEAAAGVIRVIPPNGGPNLRIEDDMLEAENRPSFSTHSTIESHLQEVGDNIWDQAQIHAILKTWLGAFNADSQWYPDLKPVTCDNNNPIMSFAPSLILRKRSHAGMLRIYEELTSQLSSGQDNVPNGWKGLVWDTVCDTETQKSYFDENNTAHKSDGPSEIYFPLPANREQRQIVEALNRSKGVLVQGPPGTGKSLTIANLICHLLATGKRILITAESPRALQVLKKKLPPEIQALCISLLGQGGDAYTELNKSVQEITTRQASFSTHIYVSQMKELETELASLREELAKTHYDIRQIRQDETVQHSRLNGAYIGTASQIAKKINDERQRFGWLELPDSVESSPPVTTGEIQQWLGIQQRYTREDIFEATLLTPELERIPTPESFEWAVNSEKKAQDAVNRIAKYLTHPAYKAVQALNELDRQNIASELTGILRDYQLFTTHQETWQQDALSNLIRGNRSPWLSLLNETTKLLAKAADYLDSIEDHKIILPQERDLRRLRYDTDIVARYLRAGNKWKKLGVITPSEVKGREYLKNEIWVDEQLASGYKELELVRDYCDLLLVNEEICSLWQHIELHDIHNNPRVNIDSFQEQCNRLKRCLNYVERCDKYSKIMNALENPIPIPDWLSNEIQTLLNVFDAVTIVQKAQDKSRELESYLEYLTRLRNIHNSHSVVANMIHAIQGRRLPEYEQLYKHLSKIIEVKCQIEVKNQIEARIVEIVPGLVRQVTSTIDETLWVERFNEWVLAWNWALTDNWLKRLVDTSYGKKLWAKLHETESKINHTISEIAALKAWIHFFDRLSNEQAASLKSWREAVRAMGKGTGKSARLARLKNEARIHMDACRDAIPVWIMPRFLVAEMITPGPERYDLVIVDEASQLGIESLFLFYLSKKMLVVGDDQQISPYGIGIPDGSIESLQYHYLHGISHKHALSPQSSLYANAKIRFRENVVLREHFRCMPEIIQFSNDLCYANNGTPLDPLRSYSPDRLKPIEVRHVTEGYRIGSSQHAQNPPEAEAIVEQVISCINDPRYENLSMGIISLQGDAQARLIEKKIEERIEPEIIKERHIICGDAYAFQGDERDIIFLSMVAAPGGMRIGSLSTESARQRFNVAASRAKDQLWLFHTATLEDLSPSGMRYKLLSYMMNPKRETSREGEQRFDSEFEREVYRIISDRGYHVKTQVPVGDPLTHRYRIDLVVEGMHGRLAVECDGDKWHGLDRYEQDMARQRDLERAGWQFIRIRGSDFYRDPLGAMEPLWIELERLNIKNQGMDTYSIEPLKEKMLNSYLDPQNETTDKALSPPNPQFGDTYECEPANESLETEALQSKSILKEDNEKPLIAFGKKDDHIDNKSISHPTLQMSDFNSVNYPSNDSPQKFRYRVFEGEAGKDPRSINNEELCKGLCKIIEVEGPMLCKRAYDIYFRNNNIRRMGGELKRLMNGAIKFGVKKGYLEIEYEKKGKDLTDSIVRIAGSPPVILRERGPREFDEIPPSEVQLVARLITDRGDIEYGSEDCFRIILEHFGQKRLTSKIEDYLHYILYNEYQYVDEIVRSRSIDLSTLPLPQSNTNTAKQIGSETNNKSFSFRGEIIHCKNWIEIIPTLCVILKEENANTFDRIFDIKGRTRPYFSQTPDALFRPEKIKELNIYYEKNLSLDLIEKVANAILETFEYPATDLEIHRFAEKDKT
jgi:Superfamily I DNA and RNA helicases and helicase subunits